MEMKTASGGIKTAQDVREITQAPKIILRSLDFTPLRAGDRAPRRRCRVAGRTCCVAPLIDVSTLSTKDGQPLRTETEPEADARRQ